MKPFIRLVTLALVSCGCCGPLFSQGIILPATGAVNRGMAGATTGTAIDPIGSLSWNPATLSGFAGNEIAFGFEALYPTYTIDSTFPNVGTGSTNSENGAMPIPSFGWVHQTANPFVKFGLGMYGVGGYASNFPTDPTNPILTPPPAQGGLGLGRIQSEAVFFQLAPSIAIAVTDRLSIGGGPLIDMGRLVLNSNPFVPPNADGTYPSGNGTRYAWGGGAQLGFYYIHDCCWEFGGNLKSPTWFEPFRYHSETAMGQPRVDTVSATLPLILSFGAAYRGLPQTTLTADVRYFNYAATELMGDPAGFAPDGSVTGLGWNDVVSLHFGAQREVSSRLVLRGGYMYATSLIDDENAFFNLGSDLSYQHMLAMGGSWRLNDCAAVSLAYNYAFEWGSTGPMYFPGLGAIPGTSVTNRLDTNSLTLGVNARY